MSALWWKCGLFPIFCCFRNTAVDNHVYMSIPIISSPVKRVQTLVILIVQICFNFSLPWNDETFVWMCYEKALSYSCLDSTLHLSSCLQVMYSFSFSFNNVSQARQCQNDYIILSWFYSYCKEFIIPWSIISSPSYPIKFKSDLSWGNTGALSGWPCSALLSLGKLKGLSSWLVNILGMTAPQISPTGSHGVFHLGMPYTPQTGIKTAQVALESERQAWVKTVACPFNTWWFPVSSPCG